jgi:UDPglucose 6-dehydrogenase
MPFKITILGTGYVGLVCGVGLADFGNYVICTDIDEDKINQLERGIIPIYEPGLEEYFLRNRKEQRLTFEKDLGKAIHKSDIIFIAVGTPSSDAGDVNLTYLQESVKAIAYKSDDPKTVITKSTVPVGTNRWIEETLKEHNSKMPFNVVSNPEFLREGKAIYDFFHPDKMVVGTDNQKAKETMQEIYRPLYLLNTPFIFCNYETAELIKYANNAFLATKITFINQIANLCDEIGADVNVIAKAMGMDGRISPKFLHPGPGFGGSCFPKDTRALIKIGERYNTDMSLIREVVKINVNQRQKMVEKLERLLGSIPGKNICALGVAFKAETDDIRESPSVDIIKILLQKGAHINLHDPQALENAKELFLNVVNYYEDMYEAMKDCDALMILTEWHAYRNLDLEKASSFLKQKIILDTRNVLDQQTCHQTGFVYEGVGRK